MKYLILVIEEEEEKIQFGELNRSTPSRGELMGQSSHTLNERIDADRRGERLDSL